MTDLRKWDVQWRLVARPRLRIRWLARYFLLGIDSCVRSPEISNLQTHKKHINVEWLFFTVAMPTMVCFSIQICICCRQHANSYTFLSLFIHTDIGRTFWINHTAYVETSVSSGFKTKLATISPNKFVFTKLKKSLNQFNCIFTSLKIYLKKLLQYGLCISYLFKRLYVLTP